ncbi:MAG TPA: heme-binding protein [Frateuria sp.]|uniref:GlcG/HbpS family heme-binding protein n=1 Tax=Frateuria sp. TaxID=2211372 RepID=UPI002D8092BB|nr:heme-binding protein [Frateuria sp.]HET6805119.1 heme-binding protein [Frateuria sp.]
MTRPTPLAAALILVLGLAACSHDNDSTAAAPPSGKGTTQAGAAGGVAMPGQGGPSSCKDLPDATQLKQWLNQVPAEAEVGGLAGGRHEWAVVVDREGRLCAITETDPDPTMPWPGSKGIAMAKAFTANAFSSDKTPMSTARLYTMSQPGRSLWGAGAGDPFNPQCLEAPDTSKAVGKVCGGVITFGGGLPLYRGKTKVGGLGLSGDTPCADHEIAKRIRHAARLDPPGGATVDDITYSSKDGASVYTHPLCPNTWRNGQKIGTAPPAQGY